MSSVPPNEVRSTGNQGQGGPDQVNTVTQNNGAGRGGRRNNRDRGPCGGRFKGKCESLIGHVYDLGTPNSSQDLFATTTKEIAEYVAREYTDAGDFGSGLMHLELPVIDAPAHPPMNNPIAMEEWKVDFRMFKDKERSHKSNTEKAFFLVMGQCLQAIRDRLESTDEWSDILGFTSGK